MMVFRFFYFFMGCVSEISRKELGAAIYDKFLLYIEARSVS
jgi:hypothetical protein